MNKIYIIKVYDYDSGVSFTYIENNLFFKNYNDALKFASKLYDKYEFEVVELSLAKENKYE